MIRSKPPYSVDAKHHTGQVRRLTSLTPPFLTLDQVSDTDKKWLTNQPINNLVQVRPFAATSATVSIGASLVGQIYDLTSTAPASYPASFYVFETTYRVFDAIGINTALIYVDDGSGGNRPPSNYTNAFFASNDTFLAGGVFQWVGDEQGGIVTPAVNLAQGMNKTIVPLTGTDPTTEVYDECEEHRTRPQIISSTYNDTSWRWIIENPYQVTGYSAGSWTYASPPTNVYRAADHLLLWVPKYSDGQRTSITGGVIIPEFRVGLPVEMGWFEEYVDGFFSNFARCTALCWNTLLRVYVPAFTDTGGGSKTFNIQTKAAPAWQLIGDGNDPDFGPSYWNDGYPVEFENSDFGGWTSVASVTTDSGGVWPGGFATVSASQPAIGTMTLVRIAFEDFNDWANIPSDSAGFTCLFDFGPTRLPFAVRTTGDMLQGHG